VDVRFWRGAKPRPEVVFRRCDLDV